LAAAGLKRLGRLQEAKSIFGAQEMLPAPGQGFLGIECRQGDSKSLEALAVLNDALARACADAERSFLDRLGAGCHAPVAALALAAGARLRLQGFTQNADSKYFRGSLEGDLKEGSDLGIRLAESLMAQGAEMTR
jgi:hydroxymethylbilane synthase